MRREERLGVPGGFVEGTTRRVVVLIESLGRRSRVLRVVVVDRRRPAAPRRPGRGYLPARQIRPAIDAAFYGPIGTSYQLQPSFHTSSTEPEPTARARGAGKEFY